MFTVRTESSFAAAHFLREYNGKCENLHGHNYKVRVYVKGVLPENSGMVVDFAILKNQLAEVLNEFDHKNLNDIPYFKEREPSAENIAYYIFCRLDALLVDVCKNAQLVRVDVFETDKNLAIYERA